MSNNSSTNFSTPESSQNVKIRKIPLNSSAINSPTTSSIFNNRNASKQFQHFSPRTPIVKTQLELKRLKLKSQLDRTSHRSSSLSQSDNSSKENSNQNSSSNKSRKDKDGFLLPFIPKKFLSSPPTSSKTIVDQLQKVSLGDSPLANKKPQKAGDIDSKKPPKSSSSDKDTVNRLKKELSEEREKVAKLECSNRELLRKIKQLEAELRSENSHDQSALQNT